MEADFLPDRTHPLEARDAREGISGDWRCAGPAGGSTEPVSILGKRSTYDADDVGVRLQWPTQMDRPADDLHRLHDTTLVHQPVEPRDSFLDSAGRS